MKLARRLTESRDDESRHPSLARPGQPGEGDQHCQAEHLEGALKDIRDRVEQLRAKVAKDREQPNG